MSAPSCRTATAAEIERMLEWATEEGWNPGLEDAAAFRAADPAGFFVAEANGAPVAAISVVNHAEAFAFLGLYLCRPEYRGRGVGFALWQHALGHADGRVVGLDGVPAQETNYARSGFVLAGRTRRLGGRLPVATPDLPVAGPGDLDELLALDSRANGMRRPAFLREWTRDLSTRKTVLLRDGTDAVGFATARVCRTGGKIGPVVAPDSGTALHLARQAAAALDLREVTIDVPDSAAAFGLRLREAGFTEGFATARMYRGTAPQSGDTLHAVATLELG